MKCSGKDAQHDMAAGQNFCPSCGAKPAAEEQIAKAGGTSCGGCGTLTTGKFCGECGSAVVTAASVQADLDTALQSLDTISKATIALPETIDLGVLDEEIGADAAAIIDDVFKAHPADDEGIVDPLPIFKAVLTPILAGQNRLVENIGLLNRELRAHRKETAHLMRVNRLQGMVMKAQGAEILGLREEVKRWTDNPKPARSVQARTATVDTKAKGLGDGSQPSNGGGEPPLVGDMFVAKAQAAFEHGKLSADDVCRLEEYVGLGARTPDQVCDLEPEFGARINAGIAAVTQ
ncbi:MAG TPA: hypothetical protein VMT89_18065 [Candidatus Acidoferrales bacterium]|nr:hypothetical protein [Candidatus Acidoferrales bacterium]